MTVKIVTSHSAFGGSTLALMTLGELLNQSGNRCELYGPHRWHLGRCSFGRMLNQFSIAPTDSLILHRCELPDHPNCRTTVLSCHETTDFVVREKNVGGVDVFHFVSESQRCWHDLQSARTVVIPNVIAGVQPITQIADHARNVAGVVGTVCPSKRTHISIERALADGVRKVLIFGPKYNDYFEAFVHPLLSERVEYVGMVNDRQQIYESIDRVYHSSLSETFGLVEAECKAVGIPFFGTPECTQNPEIWPGSRILEAWIQLLQL